MIIITGIIGIQVLIIFFGGPVFKTVPLTGEQWGFCILFGFLSLPWGVIVRLLPDEIFSFFGIKTKPPPFEPVIPKYDAQPSLRGMSHEDPGVRWNKAIENVRTELRVFSALRSGARVNESLRSLNGGDSASLNSSHSNLARARLTNAAREARDKMRFKESGGNAQPSMAAIAGIGIGLASYGFVSEPVKMRSSSTEL